MGTRTVAQSEIRVQASNFKPHEKNTLKGFFDLTLPDVGIKLVGCTLHQKNDSRWVGLPARPYQDPQSNKTCWAQIVDFASKEDRYALQRAALRAVDSISEGPGNGF